MLLFGGVTPDQVQTATEQGKYPGEPGQNRPRTTPTKIERTPVYLLDRFFDLSN